MRFTLHGDLTQGLRWLGAVTLVAAAYAATGRLGLALPYVGSYVSLIWMPTGVAVAALVRLGLRAWPGVWIGAFAVNLMVGAGAPLAFAIACGNTAGPLAAVLAMRRLGFSARLQSRRDVLLLVGVGALGGMLVTSSNGVASLLVAAEIAPAQAPGAWLYWWLGDVVGVLLAGVPLLTLTRKDLGTALRGWPGVQILVATALVLAGAIISFSGVVREGGDHAAVWAPLLLLPVAPLIWLAIRSGVLWSSLAALLLAAVAAAQTARGHGPFADVGMPLALAALWGYYLVLVVITLLLTALVAELRAAEARLRGLFLHTRDAALMTAPDGAILAANPAACALFGLSEAQIRERGRAGLIDPADPRLEPLLAQRAATGAAEGVLTFLRADGSRFEGEVQSAVYAAEGGQPHAHVIVRDVSERRRLEEVIIAAQTARRASEAKSAFLARMSHELRTPLNAILGFAQVLERDSAVRAEGRQHQWVRLIRQAGRHLLEMVDDVLDLAAVDAGRLRVERTAVELAELSEEVVHLVRHQADTAGVALTNTVAAGPLVRVLADRVRLRQVLMNLLSNAIKYNSRGGHVVLDVHGGEGSARIRVTDTGPGLSEAQLQRLFEPFNRLGAEGTGIQGTGIGLAIARGLVDLMGGSLEVSSRPGQGSTFTVVLALAEEGEPPAAPLEGRPAVRRAATNVGRRTVLFFAAEAIDADLVRGVIGMRGHLALDVARDTAAGLAAADRQPPDLVLIDLQLSGGSGLALRATLGADARFAAATFVALSAEATPALRAAAQQAGFSEFVAKPIDLQRLLQMLDERLGAAAATS